MGLGSFWRREPQQRTAGSEITPEIAGELWDSYTESLAWRLFTLPLGGRILLSPGHGRNARFTRDGGGLEWALFAPGQDNLPSRRLPWPALFEDYRSFTAMTALAFRDIFGAELPFELTAQAWIEDSGEQLDTRGIGFGEFADEPPGRDADDALDLMDWVRQLAEADREVRTHDHTIAMVCGVDVLKQQGVELLVGGDENWPVREHTVDFIGLTDDRLIVTDVFVNFEGLTAIPPASIEVDGRMVDRGSPAYAHAMVNADPDFRRVLARRPELAQALNQDRLTIEYSILEIDAEQRIRLHGFEGATDSIAPAPITHELSPADDANGPATDPIETWVPFDPYPLLKPADWPHRHQIPHWPSASGNAPIIVLAADTPDGYTMQSYDQHAPENQFLLPTAMARLSGMERYEWEFDELYGLPTANCSGHDFSAEKVLDPRAMLVAHNALRTPRLWVATPRRTCLTAVPYDLDERQRMIFQHLVRLTWDDDSFGNAPITRGAFLLEHGRIAGFVEDVDLIGRS
ncbi:hypothetical protein [Nocardia sp. NPDC056000]|uniref:hypothetical protein n=1 Tax=Nocardia sp. NPDC056000 TaxID=3345674 RepID=UPI0035D5E1E3